jgi:hypothetical protein
LSELQTRATVDGFQRGSLSFGSVGPIAFGPDGILFLADNVRAEIVALDLRDDAQTTTVTEVDNLDGRLAAFLGCAPSDVAIRGLAAHPLSQAVFLSVMRGAGDAAVPALIRVAGDGALSEIDCENIGHARSTIAHAPAVDDERQEKRGQFGIPIYYHLMAEGEPGGEEYEVPGITLRLEGERLRDLTVTDLAFVDGELLVAGASSEEFVSTLRRIPFPFREDARASALEIYHVNHGVYETYAPVRAFAPFAGGASILATYTCTPIAHFPVAELVDGARVLGRTVAELGGANTPVDIVSFTRDDGEYVLVSNTRLPLLKIDGRDIDAQDGLTEHRQPRGVPWEALSQEGVGHMAVADGQVVMLQRDDAGVHLRSYSTASI